MVKWFPPDPNDPASKGVKIIAINGNRIEIELGPECCHKEPRQGRPIPPEDRR
jgi:hypothetical protein